MEIRTVERIIMNLIGKSTIEAILHKLMQHLRALELEKMLSAI
jgi:hypothetical protein